MKPRFKVVVNGKDITETINQNASKISFHDEDGTSSDDIRLSVEEALEDQLMVMR